MSTPRVVAFIQARLTSTRLPNKVLAKIGPWTALELMLKRLEKAKTLNEVVLLIPDTKQNEPLSKYIENELKCPYVMGDEHDVLSRFVKAAAMNPADFFVRLTADCPLISPTIVDDVVRLTVGCNADYGANVNPPTFPDGFDVECFSSRSLQWIDKHADTPRWREHVTLVLREHPGIPSDFKFVNLTRNGESAVSVRLTLDYPEDLTVFQQLYERFGLRLLELTCDELIEIYQSSNIGQINGGHAHQ
jgi:glutamate-1-semialdehyde 2,1-aminomutase